MQLLGAFFGFLKSPQTLHFVSPNLAPRLPKPCTSSPQTLHRSPQTLHPVSPNLAPLQGVTLPKTFCIVGTPGPHFDCSVSPNLAPVGWLEGKNPICRSPEGTPNRAPFSRRPCRKRLLCPKNRPPLGPPVVLHAFLRPFWETARRCQAHPLAESRCYLTRDGNRSKAGSPSLPPPTAQGSRRGLAPDDGNARRFSLRVYGEWHIRDFQQCTARSVKTSVSLPEE